MRIAAVQMISGPDVGPNLQRAAELIDQAVDQGADLIVLPEYFPLIGANDAERLAARETAGHGPIQGFLSETAAHHRVWLVGGSLPLDALDPNKLRNTCLVFDDKGRQVARYDKIHLFSFSKGEEQYDESATIEAGDHVVSLSSPLGQIGLAICYDLRFPEHFRALSQGPHPASLIVLPAAFTDTTGRAHWEILLRARAIENQCYILAAAQGGRHPGGRTTHGNSMIVDPWGDILARMDKGEGVVVADFDPARLSEVRSALPALAHRKLEIQS